MSLLAPASPGSESIPRLRAENQRLADKVDKCKAVIRRLVKELEVFIGGQDARALQRAAASAVASAAAVSGGAAAGNPRAGRIAGRRVQLAVPVGGVRADGAGGGKEADDSNPMASAAASLVSYGSAAIEDLRGAISTFLGDFGFAAEQTPADDPESSVQWHDDSMGPNLAISDDGRSIMFSHNEGKLGAFAGTTRPPRVDDGYGFEVEVGKVRLPSRNEIAIGLTPADPGDWPEDLPEAADGLAEAWLVGYAGEAWRGRAAGWAEVSWQLPQLKEGTRIRVHAAFGSSKMDVFVDNEHAGSLPIPTISEHRPLWGVVDLLGAEGKVEEVTLVSTCSPMSGL